MVSNRWNYANRKQEGVDLGQTLAKNIRKHFLEKNTSPKGAASRKIERLEIILLGKQLSDEGFREIASPLEEALKITRDGESVVVLETFNLSGNSLTTASLALLARVIEAASHDLRDLDLSNNSIQVTNEHEAGEWGRFLDSFRGCAVLRRIDLRKNDLSGPLAFEILWKSYSRQPSVDPTDLSSPELLFDPGAKVVDALAPGKGKAVFQEDDETNSDSALSNATILKRRRGLRAVPYILLGDVNMTDYGTLHFSYVLAEHSYPQHLDDLTKAMASAQIDERAQMVASWGLEYLPNDSLSTTGVKVLSLAEDIRRQRWNIRGDMIGGASEGSYTIVNAKQSTPIQRRIPTDTSSSHRRTSTRSSSDASDDYPEIHPELLDSMRKKFQRSIIEDVGIHGSQLWRVAIQSMLRYRVFIMRPASWSKQPRPVRQSQPPVSKTRKLIEKAGPHLRSFVQASLLDWTTSPRNFAGLPDRIWKQIIEESLDGVGVLSEHQRDRVFQWATDLNNLEVARQLQNKSSSTQIWTVLAGMECLTYP